MKFTIANTLAIIDKYKVESTKKIGMNNSYTIIEAIPKADYENRLKADMVAMLTEIQLEIEELDVSDVVPEYQDGAEESREYIANLIQQKIDALKGEQEAADDKK